MSLWSNCIKLYNVYSKWNNLSPSTQQLCNKVIIRVAEVAAEADKAADKAAADEAANAVAEEAAERRRIATADSIIINPPTDDSDFNLNTLDRWNHTSRKGGSRKRSINCRRPRGFSQRQHCKYGRRGRGWKRTTTRRQTRSSRD